MKKLMLVVLAVFLWLGAVMANDIWGGEDQHYKYLDYRTDASHDVAITTSNGYLKSITFTSATAGDWMVVMDSYNWHKKTSTSTTDLDGNTIGYGYILIDVSIDTAKQTIVKNFGENKKGLPFGKLFYYTGSATQNATSGGGGETPNTQGRALIEWET